MRKEPPHYSIDVVKGDDGVITVTFSTAALTNVTSVTGGIHFDMTKLVCTNVINSNGKDVPTESRKVYLHSTTEDENVPASTVSSPTEANKNGNVGFAFALAEEDSYDAGVIFTAKFTVKDGATGEAAFTIYESTGGTGGYNKDFSADYPTSTKIEVAPEVEPTDPNLALPANGGTAFANSAKDGAPVSGLNDTTNVRWQPSESTPGDEVYAGIRWAEAKTIDKLIFMWRDVQYAPAIDGADYLIQYSNDTTTGKDGTWTSIGNVEKVRLGKGAYADIIGDRLTNSNDDITQKNCAVDTVSFEPITVKAIRILMKIPEGKNQIQLFEMEVYAPASFTVQKELIAKAASGKEGLVDKFELTSIDKATFGENDIVKVDYTITRGDKTESGTRYIESAWKGIKLTLDGVPTELTAASLGGANGEYLTGIIFRNLKESDVVEVTYSIVAAPEE